MFARFGRFVRNFGGVFAILFEGLLIEIQEEIHHFAVLGGGLKGAKIVNKNFVNNKLVFPIFTSLEDPNLLKLKSLDSHCPFFLSDNGICGH